ALVRRQVYRARHLPKDLVSRLASAQVHGHEAWKEARKQNNFRLFQDSLSDLFKLRLEYGELLKKPEQTVYEALFEDYEPDTPISFTRKLFAEYKREIVAMIPGIVE